MLASLANGACWTLMPRARQDRPAIRAGWQAKTRRLSPSLYAKGRRSTAAFAQREPKRSEPVVQSDARRVGREVETARAGKRVEGRQRRQEDGEIAVVGIEIFTTDRPIAVDRIFDAATDRPAVDGLAPAVEDPVRRGG